MPLHFVLIIYRSVGQKLTWRLLLLARNHPCVINFSLGDADELVGSNPHRSERQSLYHVV